MAIRRSTKLINDLVRGYGVRELLRDGRIFVYTGAQPTTADAAPNGTLLMTFTLDGNSYTDATRATATINLSGSGPGSLDTVTVGGMGFNLLSHVVDFDSTLETTAYNAAETINATQNPLNITAESSTTNIILSSPYWVGADANGLTFATSTSGSLTASASGLFAGGISAINGINFKESVSDGVISKATETWQAIAIAAGTAGWFRFVPCGSTVDGVANTDIRFDGTVGTNNADLLISTTAIVEDAVHTISSGSIKEPKE